MPNRWDQMLAALNEVPTDKQEREQLLETCKHIGFIDPITSNDMLRLVSDIGILYPNYRLASDDERERIADAFVVMFSGADSDLIETAFHWYAESPAQHFCAPGQLMALVEPMLAARAWWRIEAGRIASKIQPGLKLVSDNG